MFLNLPRSSSDAREYISQPWHVQLNPDGVNDAQIVIAPSDQRPLRAAGRNHLRCVVFVALTIRDV